MSKFAGSIGLAFSFFASAVASPPFAPLLYTGAGWDFAAGFLESVGDFPVGGVFSGSVCACSPNVVAKIKNETSSDFFIRAL